jgi:hypothetical protein
MYSDLTEAIFKRIKKNLPVSFGEVVAEAQSSVDEGEKMFMYFVRKKVLQESGEVFVFSGDRGALTLSYIETAKAYYGVSLEKADACYLLEIEENEYDFNFYGESGSFVSAKAKLTDELNLVALRAVQQMTTVPVLRSVAGMLLHICKQDLEFKKERLSIRIVNEGIEKELEWNKTPVLIQIKELVEINSNKPINLYYQFIKRLQ